MKNVYFGLLFCISVMFSLVLVAPNLASAATITLSPNGAGHFDQWSLGTPSSGTKANAVASNDGDTSYISETSDNDAQTFTIQGAGLPTGTTINSVTLNVVARESQGSAEIQLRVEKGTQGNDIDDDFEHNLTGSYATHSRTLTKNPFTNSAWTLSEVNSWTTRFGVQYKDSGSSNTGRITQVSVVVDYTLPVVDTDGDGIADSRDNCPSVANPDQLDTDNDGLGNVCDLCPSTADSTNQFDDDHDGLGNSCDNYNCVYTGAEVCSDGIDNNCNGYVDESCGGTEIVVTCDAGFHAVDNQCVADEAPADPTCSEGQHLDNHTCVANEVIQQQPDPVQTDNTSDNGGGSHRHGGRRHGGGEVLGASTSTYGDLSSDSNGNLQRQLLVAMQQLLTTLQNHPNAPH